MKREILLIEDDLPTIEVYRIALERAGFKLEALTWGYRALERLKEIKEEKAERPDLILLDLILLDINGLEILEKARKEEKTKDIPFFILTNYTDPNLEKIGKDLRVEKYIVKANYTPSQLVEIIKEYFRN